MDLTYYLYPTHTLSQAYEMTIKDAILYSLMLLTHASFPMYMIEEKPAHICGVSCKCHNMAVSYNSKMYTGKILDDGFQTILLVSTLYTLHFYTFFPCFFWDGVGEILFLSEVSRSQSLLSLAQQGSVIIFQGGDKQILI